MCIRDSINAEYMGTRGVEQINIAVSQMDKVTQNIASTAEEGAASAEELEAQAMSMKKIVEELEMIVHGTVSNTGEEYYEKRQIKRDSNMYTCLLYTSPSPRDLSTSRMPSSA
eukprot:TRINITY_DN7878_c0_g1_i2.p1 TRINITY_DN7878_c0_g1~~TRINITY_DN7878_c0_g1_i2.p1  ORF type:complete len:113 (-),score=31.83 TRINITY_DN7878_c0_g1_i2:72-410(-)